MSRRGVLDAKAAALALSSAAIALFGGTTETRSADWSVTEIQHEYGKLTNPFTGTKSWTPIITLQHASGNKFGVGADVDESAFQALAVWRF